VLGGGATQLRAQVPPRLRPGDRPVWVDLDLGSAQTRTWRSRATAYRLPLNAWLGLLLEYKLVSERLEVLGGDPLIGAVLEEAERVSLLSRLAPTAELRCWVAQTGGNTCAGDDLPSVVLAGRLLAQLPHDGRAEAICAAASSGKEEDAVRLDQVAAAEGLTPEAWAYLAALRVMR
jgi:hypothetical protein